MDNDTTPLAADGSPVPVPVDVAARILVLPDGDGVAREAASLATSMAADAIRERGEAHLCLTGGSSAVALYRELAGGAWHGALDWSRVHLWWGDERIVPLDHPDSNAGIAFGLLLRATAHAGMSGEGGSGTDVLAGDLPALPVDPASVHPFPVDVALRSGGDAAAAAEQHAATVRSLVPLDERGVPAFDVLFLGVGPDGHILSVFPGSAALEPGAPIVMPIPAPTHVGPHQPRLTLDPRCVTAARLVIAMVPGAGKRGIVADVLGSRPDVGRWPAQLALGENAVWLLDRESSSGLGRP